jgi:glycerol uptake facilitator protein
VLYEPSLAAREQQRGVKRGEVGSEITAMCYGEYYPNPGPVSTDDTIKQDREKLLRRLQELKPRADVTIAVLAEILATALLALVVFAVTDEHNEAAPMARLGPAFIGLTVAVLISVIAPLTQACLNPARDFGPRMVAWAVGWGEVALGEVAQPGPTVGVFLVYLLAPTLGAILGGGVYLGLVRPFLTAPPPPGRVTS